MDLCYLVKDFKQGTRMMNAEKAEYSFLVDKTSHPTGMKRVKLVHGVIVFKNARCFKNKITVLIELH